LFFSRLFNKPSPKEKKLKLFLKQFGIAPKKIELYSAALRHKSAATANITSNERLEFLGDSVLNSIIADYLYSNFPNESEGYLSKMRSRFVNRLHLNLLAQKMGLEKVIETKLEKNDFSTTLIGNAFEALIGAIYLDKGYIKTKKIVINNLFKKLVDFRELMNKETDYKSRLLEWGQKEKKEISFVHKSTSFEEGHGFIVEVLINGIISGNGKGLSKKQAEQQASEMACKSLSGN
jgi:ribonuclease III